MIATVTLLFQRLSIAIQHYLRAHNRFSTSIRTSSHSPFLLSTLSFSPTLHYTAYNNKLIILPFVLLYANKHEMNGAH